MSDARTAKALIGKVPGFVVEVPTDAHNTTRKVKINAIRPCRPLAEWEAALAAK